MATSINSDRQKTMTNIMHLDNSILNVLRMTGKFMIIMALSAIGLKTDLKKNRHTKFPSKFQHLFTIDKLQIFKSCCQKVILCLFTPFIIG